jgi:hypothetical protein
MTVDPSINVKVRDRELKKALKKRLKVKCK